MWQNHGIPFLFFFSFFFFIKHSPFLISLSLWYSFFMFKEKRKVTLIALVRAVSEDFTVQIGALIFAFFQTPFDCANESSLSPLPANAAEVKNLQESIKPQSLGRSFFCL